MLNIGLQGDTYELNIMLPDSRFNDELLKKVVGPTYKKQSKVSSIYRTKNISELHKVIEKLLTLFKLLDYGA